MKLFILLALTLTGCSSLSEYRRGCQDGIDKYDDKFSVKERTQFCKLVEQQDQLKQKAEKGSKR